MFRKLFLLASLSTVLCLVTSCGTQKADFGPNLAQGKTVTASSFEKANKYNGNVDSAPGFVVDNDMKTRWSSDWSHDADPNIAWLVIDLSAPTPVKAVQIFWEAAFASGYTIEVSDDAQKWTVVYETKNNFLLKNTINLDKPVTTRYVKLNCNTRKTTYGYSVFEFQVY